MEKWRKKGRGSIGRIEALRFLEKCPLINGLWKKCGQLNLTILLKNLLLFINEVFIVGWHYLHFLC